MVYIKYGDIIVLKHAATGKHLNRPGDYYTHNNSSERAMVTASTNKDLSSCWLVKRKDGEPEEHLFGHAVKIKSTIRLENVSSSENLHSQNKTEAPATPSQQEVSTFNAKKVGDSDDNWRIEFEGKTWETGRDINLFHVGTKKTLHSHENRTIETKKGIEQEVTCSHMQKDKNDNWIAEIVENHILIDKSENSLSATSNNSTVARDYRHQQDFIPDEDNKDEVIVIRNHIRSLCIAYSKAFAGDVKCNRTDSIYLEFLKHFFNSIKGWETVASKTTSEESNNILFEIVSGPSSLKDKLGSTIYIECYEDVTEMNISWFFVQLLLKDLKAGIIFSSNEFSKESKQMIKNLYSKKNIYMIPISLKDIDLVRNGKNIVRHLHDLINNFISA